MSYRSNSNRNSRIVTQRSSTSWTARSTYTDNRDPGSLQALVDTQSNNATDMVINRNGVTLQLTGHEARTLYALLDKHYNG
jgi:hypothetical protein